MAQASVSHDMSQSLTAWAKQSWSSFQWERLSAKLGGSSTALVQGFACFGAGFIIGMILKKSFKFFFAVFICTLILTKWLEFHQVIIVNWDNFQTLIGFQIGGDVAHVVQGIFTWIQQNVVIFSSSSFGFLLGYKLA